MGIITKDLIFNDNTINIFTDASLTKKDDEYITMSGSIAVKGDSIIDTSLMLLRNSTNNVGEITAIKLGISQALFHRNEALTINLFSDSKISLFGLREWIFKWVYNPVDQLLYGSSGIPVANQSIFLDIVYMIIDNNLSINLYHTPGHADYNKFIKVFRESNFVKSDMDMNFINTMIKYNDYIDKYTRTELMKCIPNIDKDYPLLISPIVTQYQEIDFDYYKTLLNIK